MISEPRCKYNELCLGSILVSSEFWPSFVWVSPEFRPSFTQVSSKFCPSFVQVLVYCVCDHFVCYKPKIDCDIFFFVWCCTSRFCFQTLPTKTLFGVDFKELIKKARATIITLTLITFKELKVTFLEPIC